MSLRIKELDALRGIAALFVVLFHYSMGKVEAGYGFKLGVTGVDLFFIISGFVIFMSIQKVSSGTEFVINRFTRLYPTYWACATVTFLAALFVHYNIQIENQVSFIQYMVNLTMFQSYFNIKDLDGPYWTMIVEMLFYIYILLLFVSNKIKYTVNISLILLTLIGIYCVFLDDIYPDINSDFVHWFHLYTHFPLFLTGILFYKITQKEGKLFLNYVLLSICFIIQINLFDNFPKAADFISFMEYIIMLSVYYILFILFINGKLAFIVCRPTLFLGKISFALYLIHQFISIDFVILILQKNGITNFWITSSIALSISIMLALLITQYIEIPLGGKLNHFFRLKFNLPVKRQQIKRIS